MAKKKIKKKISKQLGRFLSDNKLSRKELRKISSKAKKKGFTGSNKRLAKIISKKAQKINPKARNVGIKKNTKRLNKIKSNSSYFGNVAAQTPLMGPLQEPTKPASPTLTGTTPTGTIPTGPTPTGPTPTNTTPTLTPTPTPKIGRASCRERV